MSGRKSVKLAAKEAMQRLGYDPLEALVSYAQNPDRSEADKRDVALALLPYMYPKLSNIVVEGEITTSQTENTQAELFKKFMENPELADAAQKLSLAAAEVALQADMGGLPN